jgi:hypothetical protein
MSDDYLKIIPTSPDHVPPSRTHKHALTLLELFLPEGEDFQAEIYDEIEFIDQAKELKPGRELKPTGWPRAVARPGPPGPFHLPPGA